MMRSMYSGVSGLKTHQIKMDVIGNNIANVNTVAFKSNSITFSELMYQTTQKASGANANTGGTNARQIGLGVRSGAIATAISSQGATQTTGNPFDICITGKSFFIVNDGSTNYFTRSGAFNVDAVGNLVMASNGYLVQGWGLQTQTTVGEDGKEVKTPVEGKLDTENLTSLKIMSDKNMNTDPEATTKGTVSGVVDRNDPEIAKEAGRLINYAFYDNRGESWTAKFTLHNTTDVGKFYVTLDEIVDVNGKSLTDIYPGTKLSDLVSIDDGAEYDASVNSSYTKLDTVEFNKDTGTFSYTVKDTSVTPATETAVTQTLTNLGTLVAASDDDGALYKDSYRITAAKLAENDGALATTLKQIYGSNLDTDTIDTAYISADGTLTVTKKSGLGVNLNFKSSDGSFDGIGGNKSTIKLNFVTNPTNSTTNEAVKNFDYFTDNEIDWSVTNMYNNKGTSSIAARSGDSDGLGAGRRLGKMTGVTIQTNGMIYASYDNGVTRLLGQIGVAEFPNPEGLEKQGDNLYIASLNSGEFTGAVDITQSGGYMSTGVLEMSNVDLSAEFTEMITTQRGFQANSRIITVSDTMLEELVNLKR
ncbi:MAG: flagellar hook-basal body complex protein [Lachnospiraceae bacterium]|nr:flagellar hook-basal body complex protein [Lachnospiraceae bacterium]MBR5993976.1 flagellar hook-basal body complex protein [Lachnospiraceae bacterium]